MESLLTDLRYALRRIRKSPGFSLIVIATLALGIGANTAIFSVVNTILLQPLPYHAPERLATVFHFYPSLHNLEAGVSAPGFRQYRDRSNVFESAAVETPWRPTLTGVATPERLTGARVSGDWFTTFGVVPMAGRPLRRDEDEVGKQFSVVLSYRLWQRLFSGDRSVVGSGHMMMLDGEPYEIVGVMPRSFTDFWSNDVDLWRPLALPSANFDDRNFTNEYLNLSGRLKPGLTPEVATKQMSAFATQLKSEFPNNLGGSWTLKLRTLNEQSSGTVRKSLLVLLGAVGFVLLIACANVANLMLARAAARRKEIVLRTALGAKRAQIIRQLLTESVVLAFGGAVAGLGLAYIGVRSIVAINPMGLPRSGEIGIDASVLAFTFAVAVVTGLGFGLVPAVQASRANLQESLKEGGRGTPAARNAHRVRSALVVTQVALALTLLCGAGLLMRSFERLSAVDPGFKPANLLTFTLALPPAKYVSDTSVRAYYAEALPRIAAVPGVKAVGATTVAPFSGQWSTGSFNVEGYQPPPKQPSPWGDIRLISTGFFEMMGMPILKGRTFTIDDSPSSHAVAIVDEEMAHRFWPNASPISKRIIFGPPGPTNQKWIEIVGMVAHAKHEGLDADPRVQLYLPITQSAARNLTVGVRTAAAPLSMTSAVRAAVQTVDKDIPLARVQTMDQMIANSTGPRRMSMVLIAAFSTLALVLAAIGIYGVMSYSVTQRAQEIGVRMALGAGQRSVLTLVLRQGMELAVLGVLLGVFGGLWLTRLVAAQLYKVDARDPATFTAVALALSAVAFVATLVPALRATRVDPVEALRAE